MKSLRIIFCIILFSVCWLPLSAQTVLEGEIRAQSGEMLQGAGVRLEKAARTTVSDANGYFRIALPSANDTLIITHMSFRETRIPVTPGMPQPLLIILERVENTLEEVEVNTGFYRVPRERVTGSFTHVDNSVLNRSVGGNILQRLEGIASGVQFTQANGTSPSDIRVRGLATIESSEEPLIVVDNFPYEGDINAINPNDIESVTVLKDAAASSIWGARAGNGVIVITTKQGHYNRRSHISFNSNVTVGDKPDLFYSQRRLPSDVVMQIEEEKYKQGGHYLPTENQSPFPEYVELLIKRDEGELSEEEFYSMETVLRNTDVREEALRYLYQQSLYQQYALNVSGGGENYSYYLSSGYDKNRSEVIGNGNSRLNLSLQNTFKPIEELELSVGGWYTQSTGTNNGLTLSNLRGGGAVYLSPYIRLADENGAPLPIIHEYRLPYAESESASGLLDWQYRPLDEIRLADHSSLANQLRLNGRLRFNTKIGFSVEASYQYVQDNGRSTSYYDPESYYVRNLVNRFTQPNGSTVIPHGGILVGGSEVPTTSHSGRGQLNYRREFGGVHELVALLGGEARQRVQEQYPGYTIYNYDSELLTGSANYNYTQNYEIRPIGRARVSPPSVARNRYTDRYLSYFANMSYGYGQRYILSASARWDGSNLFGVKTNQKGTPLWSAGFSWETSKEGFYRFELIPYLRWRVTYGSAGNINKRVSTYPTIFHAGPDWITGLQNAWISSAGNPSLRWEQVNTLNIGLDFSTKNKRFSGSADYYIKYASDLIGADYLAPSTGIITGGLASNTNLINYANLQTHGLDFQLTSVNVQGAFSWQTTVLANYVRNEITHYNTNETLELGSYFNPSTTPPVIGRSRDVVYAQPWHGLDHNSGLPGIYVGDEQSTDYRAYWDAFTPDQLLVAGVSVPPYHGSIRNDFSWRGISLSALISWKAGYVFRRGSMFPGREYETHGAVDYHMDYFKRWQQPGDEKHTNVPTGAGANTLAGSYAYRYTQALISSGDLIRLQDVSLSYTLDARRLGIPFQRIRFYAYARNLGVLWKANRDGIDPDFADAEFPAPRTVALGLQLTI